MNEHPRRGARPIVVALFLIVVAAVALPAFSSLAGPDWSGTGHFVLEQIGYTPSPYTVAPNFRQASTSTNAPNSAISSADSADLFVNFEFDTTDKRVYVVYTADGTPPRKTNGFSIEAAFSLYTEPNRTWRVSVPTQAAGTTVNYLFYISDGDLASAWGRVSGQLADHAVSQYQTSWAEDDGAYFTYTVGNDITPTPTPTPAPISLSAARAMWLEAGVLAWNGAAGSSYRLLYDPDGGLTTAAEATACAFSPSLPASPCYVNLTIGGTVSGYPKNPNATGRIRLTAGLDPDHAKHLLKGQVVVASYDGGGARLDATRVQVQGVLDHLYVDNGTADDAVLGVTYSADATPAPTVRVWAPTAKSVKLNRYAAATGDLTEAHTMSPDAASGVWSVTGDASWDRQYYLFEVEVYVPSLDKVEKNLVTDPYSVSLSQDGVALGDVRSQFANLTDPNLKPTSWDALAKPALAAPEDIVVYEMHVRDFSINDGTVAAADRGKYTAFTYDGAGPHPKTALSGGMSHLLQLKDAGLTHVHLLPAFDIASVIEPATERSEPAVPAAARHSEQQQAAVGAARAADGFNWGYDPYHYGVPEGSYSTDPNGVQRILEFRDMVSALNRNGLRVVMDVVYNHTAAAGQDDKSVLDKVVPGYYYRYDAGGTMYNSSCCADTAMEYAMMEKLMIDTVVRFAVDYKVDGFRFDLMNLHTRRNMEHLRDAVRALTPASSGVEGDEIYLYGEGWDFGSARDKGLTDCTDGWCYAQKYNMTGAGIGLFNDIIRDAAHGGYSQDPLQIRRQGFINGLSYDWNGYEYASRWQNDLWIATDELRSALRGSGTDWNGQGKPFTADPQEAVNYVEKHDNETLFDQNVFKLPPGVTMADRVRVQNLGQSIVGLAQGIPFIQMGSDILRSKSLDRNSYDSGDWFNRIWWDRSRNNFGVGLPPEWDNGSRWSIMSPLLANTALDPATSDMDFAAAHLREILRIRKSSPLFRLPSEAEINARVTHYNSGNTQDALIALRLSDEAETDLDGTWENILVFFNADKRAQSITISGAAGFALHPVHTDGVDDDSVITGGASFNDGTDTFTIPARTTAVFVSTQAITPALAPTTIDWVGKMFPRGGVSHAIGQGAFGPTGFDVVVRVYDAGVTEAAGAPDGIACTLHWGKYGEPFSDLPMSYNLQYGNDDEFKATIPQATLNALGPDTYGFTAWCSKPGEDKKWKVDQYDIDFAGDDDQGDGLITVIPSADPRPAPAGGVFVHLFEWRWADIAKECTYLAQKGYTAVQVSPPNEHLVPTADQGGQEASDFPWWARYQPVTHDVDAFTSRSGTWAEFESMVATCNSLGVGIYVDAVINHMADIEVGTPPAGTSGTQYDSTAATRFYGGQYQTDDFHTDCTISDYGDRYQVQRCKLSGLPDLDTGKADVQTELRGYLQALIDAGVRGFRVDGAKHMPAHEIAAIFDGLTGDFYVFQEMIDASGERVRDWEYAPNGDVTEFAYPYALGAAFDDACGGSLSDLEGRFDDLDMLPSRFAQVFTDNHDNQRGHGLAPGQCIVDHRDGPEHVLANIFALAYPYGYPAVTSSYHWQASSTDITGDSKGPPSATAPFLTGSGGDTRPVYGDGQAAGSVPDNCSASFEDGKWACEHRNTAIANMVRFRQATAGEAVTWHNIGTKPTDHIALGLDNKGFVAINRTGSAATTTYQTGLPAASYCNIVVHDFLGAEGRCVLAGTTTDVAAGELIVVDANKQIVGKTLGAMDAFAIHVDARQGVPTAVTLTHLTASTQGEAIEVAWDTASEVDHLGFNLYRAIAPDGPWTQLNAALIPAQEPGSPLGHHYTYLDAAGLEPGTTYWYALEDVSTSGEKTRHAPVSVTYGGGPTAIGLARFEARPAAGAMAVMIAIVAMAVLRWKIEN